MTWRCVLNIRYKSMTVHCWTEEVITVTQSRKSVQCSKPSAAGGGVHDPRVSSEVACPQLSHAVCDTAVSVTPGASHHITATANCYHTQVIAAICLSLSLRRSNIEAVKRRAYCRSLNHCALPRRQPTAWQPPHLGRCLWCRSISSPSSSCPLLPWCGDRCG